MKYLQELPFLEEDFSNSDYSLSDFSDFPLSRRESSHNFNLGGKAGESHLERRPSEEASITHSSRIISPNLAASQPPLQRQRLDWMNEVKKNQQKFTFSQDVLSELAPLQKRQSQSTTPHLFAEESDQILALIKRMMYAEGDLVDLQHECALELKQALYDM